MTQTQREKAETLRALHSNRRILALPNAWDAASARLYEAAGFSAIGTTSAGIAFSLGYPDGQVVPRDEMLFIVRRIIKTVQVPVTVDIEAGYGAGTVEDILMTAKDVLTAGGVGINLEDILPGETTLADADLQREKIQAIRALGEAEGIPLVINARTDAFHLAHLDTAARLALAIERANLYLAAGADCAFVPFVTDVTTISALVQAIDGPLNVLATVGAASTAELERLGVARVSIGGGPYRSVMAMTRKIAEELRDQGTYTSFLDNALSYAEANHLFAKS